jgi:hypothetical protein
MYINAGSQMADKETKNKTGMKYRTSICTGVRTEITQRNRQQLEEREEQRQKLRNRQIQSKNEANAGMILQRNTSE